jgi:hypothetical protein
VRRIVQLELAADSGNPHIPGQQHLHFDLESGDREQSDDHSQQHDHS